MSTISLALLVLCVLAVSAPAQQKIPCGTEPGILLSKDKPTIYITFERVGKVKPTSTRLAATGKSQEKSDNPDNENIQVVWLRLHNNTSWAINFATDSLYVGPMIIPIRLCDGRGALGLRTGIEVNPRYEIETVLNDPKSPVINRSHMFSTSWLPPGGSVIFSVPREHLG